jgi:phenolic acid decarboxylase
MSLEAFPFHRTHYPIRFNRRTRIVYAFKLDGKIIRARWDDLFFTMERGLMMGIMNRDIRVHVLDADGETIRETFALPFDGVDVDNTEINNIGLLHTWEFFRRYMEEGTESVYPYVRWCHDIIHRREKYRDGLRCLLYDTPQSYFARVIFFPYCFLVSIGRWVVMHTCRIQKWPADIEAECRVDENDPYIKDASSNPKRMPTETFFELLKRKKL